jgi:hypothetical protein
MTSNVTELQTALRAAQQETQQLREQLRKLCEHWILAAEGKRFEEWGNEDAETRRIWKAINNNCATVFEHCARDLFAALAAAPEPQETKK